MNDRPDLRELVGDDVPEPELERLRRADEALRGTPAPPEVPASLTDAVLAIPGRKRRPSRRRLLVAIAAAAAIAGASLGIGIWLGNDMEETAFAETITLHATAAAPASATMVIHVLPEDEAGNWPMAADVSGLAALSDEGFYEVWLTKGDELVMSCGRFVVDEHGQAKDVWLNGPYRFADYDRWVVVAWTPDAGMSDWLLDGPVAVPA